MPVIVHNGLIYVSGQGAHDTRDQKEWTIESHTTMVMDKIKKHVEIGGGSMDSILQANVFLVKIEHWDGMHKVFSTYFPHGGPRAQRLRSLRCREIRWWKSIASPQSPVSENAKGASLMRTQLEVESARVSRQRGLPSLAPSSRLASFFSNRWRRSAGSAESAASDRPAIPTKNLA